AALAEFLLEDRRAARALAVAQGQPARLAPLRAGLVEASLDAAVRVELHLLLHAAVRIERLARGPHAALEGRALARLPAGVAQRDGRGRREPAGARVVDVGCEQRLGAAAQLGELALRRELGHRTL